MKLPRALTPHEIVVKIKTGDGAYGPIHADPERLDSVRVEDKIRMVRTRDGREVVSTATVWLRPEHGHVSVGSLVTVWPGTEREREAEVLAVAHLHTPPAPTHDELNLT